MTKEKTMAYCRRCGHDQTFVRRTMRHGWHAFFSLLTLGLWGVSWVAFYIGLRLHPWRCQQCESRDPIFPSGPGSDDAAG